MSERSKDTNDELNPYSYLEGLEVDDLKQAEDLVRHSPATRDMIGQRLADAQPYIAIGFVEAAERAEEDGLTPKDAFIRGQRVTLALLSRRYDDARFHEEFRALFEQTSPLADQDLTQYRENPQAA